jgi:hypothetical protein
MERLLENDDFKRLIIDEWNNGTIDLVLHESLDSQNVIDQLKARQIFNNYIYDIINEANMVIEQQRKETE